MTIRMRPDKMASVYSRMLENTGIKLPNINRLLVTNILKEKQSEIRDPHQRRQTVTALRAVD